MDIESINSVAIKIFVGIILGLILLFSINIIRPTERALIERFGKYVRFGGPGLNLVIPFIETIRKVNITEKMIDAEKQEIITEDNLNATVDAQVYYKVKQDEDNVKASQYNVNAHEVQIVALARTTLRNIIGNLSLKQCNSDRNAINRDLETTLRKETAAWGIEVVRTELKEIEPPEDVQSTMNKIVKAENEKISAKDYATARETEADGIKRAEIKKAEGDMQSRILIAEGKAKSIELEFDAANKHFIENAQILRKLETVETTLSNNTKIVLPIGEGMVNVIGNLAGVEEAVVQQVVKTDRDED